MRIFGKAEENSDFRDFRNSVLDYFLVSIITAGFTLGSIIMGVTFFYFIDTGNSGAFLFFLFSIIIFSCTVWLYKLRIKKVLESMTVEAQRRELALDYDSAIVIWEELGKIEEAARVRKLKARQGSVRVAQKVVKGDEITKTEIKDSVISKSNIGGGGKSKAEQIKEIKELLDSGTIDAEDYQKMKQEIVG